MTTAEKFLNQRAPDFELPDTTGGRHGLGESRGEWALLVFLRHLSCLFCRAHLDRITARRAEFDALGVRVAAVTFEGLEKAKPYAEELQLAPWPLLIDEEKKVYEAFGMGSAGLWGVMQPANWVGYGQLFLQGYAPRVPLPGTDVLQLGGDVLIDPAGIIRLHDCSEPAYRLPPEKFLEVVRGQ